MTCLIYERRIGLYAGGDLDDAEAQVVEAHLATCAPCRSLLVELRQQQASLAAWGEQIPEQEDLNVVREKVLSAAMRGDVTAAPRPWSYAGRWLARAIPAAATAILLLFIWQSMKRPDVEPSTERLAEARPDNIPAGPTVAAPSPPATPPTVQPAPTPAPTIAGTPRPSRRAVSSQARSRRAERDIEAALAVLATTPTVPAPQLGRIEFKTADPNIRIVWLLPDGAPPAREDRRLPDDSRVHLIEEGRVP